MPGTTHVSSDESNPAARNSNRFLRLAELIEDALLVSLFSLMVVVSTSQILLRNLLDIGLSWGDQLTRILVLWVGLLGALSASKDNKQINIALLSRFLPPTAEALSQSVTGLFTALVCALMALYGGRFVYLDSQLGTLAFGIVPLWILELILPVGFGLISVRYLLFSVNQFIHRPRRRTTPDTRDR